MTKRELAIASINNSLDEFLEGYGASQLLIATEVVDNLIRDGIISLTYAGDPDTSLLVDTFQREFGTTATVRTDRFAASRLVKRHGVHYVTGVVEELARRHREKFAPTVNNITQLEQKWPAVVRFIESKGEGEHDI